MASRYATTVYNRQQRTLSSVVDVFGRAKSFHPPHSKIVEELTTKVWETRDFQKLPAYERGYVRGIVDASYRELWNLVIWRTGPVSGPTQSALEPWTEEMSKLSRTEQLYGGHFWPTGESFTEYTKL